MTSVDADILNEAKNFVIAQFTQRDHPHLLYHNLTHTKRVVNKVQLISEHSKLTNADKTMLEMAAWFHDIGYLETYENHEDASIRIAEDFLAKREVDQLAIATVSDTINSTKPNVVPQNKLQQILSDADMLHLSSKDYLHYSELIRKERSNVLGKIKKKQWIAESIKLFEQHQYYTDYAQSNFDESKESNLKKMKQMQANNSTERLQLNKKKKKKRKEALTPTRGIETLFRTTSRNHIDLSAIADSKANILISVNAILLSVVVSVILRNIQQYVYLLIPSIILISFSVITIIFAILATLPTITQGRFSKEKVHQNKANLLFFGNFHNMSAEDYEWGIRETIKDGELIYGSITRDIYHLGKVLAKKYQMLRTAYIIFMIGLVISMCAFIIAVSTSF
ncbi:MAG: Pycsar system effector family protein [Bacteroidota bacterium]